MQRGYVQGSLSNEKALMIMKEGRGKHFDPELPDLFIEHLDRVVAIREAYRGEPGGEK